jgi:FSR family fosmidomycin resistance protein-like MFS transporter
VSIHHRSTRRAPAALIVALLAVELVDELVFGARNAAWPLMRTDLGLTYGQIGALLALPTVFGSLVEPAVGILGDAWRRRTLLIGGGVAFVASVATTAVAHSWVVLLLAFAVFNPASGAFVGLSQATLMDLAPERHEKLMARWVVAGSLGVVAGTTLVGVIAHAGGTWRAAFVMLGAIAAIALCAVIAVRAAVTHAPVTEAQSLSAALRTGARDALDALRRPEVRRWLILLECSDLMLDVLGSFLALYLVDVAHATPAQAAFGLALFAGVGLGGDALLVPILERTDGLRYLRASVLSTLAAFPALLLVRSLTMKWVLIAALGLLNSGWYAIPKARLYSAMPGRSATVMTLANTFGLVAALVPLALGAAAQRIGLAPTMWLLLLGPVGLALGLFRRESERNPLARR